MNWQTYGRLLAHEGLVRDASLPAREHAAMPWYVKLLSGFGAWLAALFVLGALGAASFGLLESAPARAGLGIVACGLCAYILRSRDREPGPFLAQFLTAISIAGAALVVSLLLDGPLRLSATLLAGALVAAMLLIANPEPVHRLLMALGMVGCLTLASIQWGLHPVACVVLALATSLIWLKQAGWTHARLGPLLVPVGMACAAALVLLPAYGPVGELLGREAGTALTGPGLAAHAPWLTPAGLAVVLAATILLVGRDLPHRVPAARVAWFPALAVAATAVVALAAWQAPGVIACLLVWVVGMAAGRPVLGGLALAGLAWYLLQLYYSLQTSLLGKGMALLGTGVVLLVLHFVLARWPPSRPPARTGADGG